MVVTVSGDDGARVGPMDEEGQLVPEGGGALAEGQVVVDGLLFDDVVEEAVGASASAGEHSKGYGDEVVSVVVEER